MKKVIMALSLVMVFGVSVINAQTRTIRGTVTGSEDGLPVAGATVVIKGTTTGTITQMDGDYMLSVPQDAETLVFSFIGMQSQEVTIDGRSTINVSMGSDAIAMDEVVVTALGVSRTKKSLGYASQGVGSDEIMSANSANPISALSGKVAGLTISGQNFSGSQNILIRGASSFSQNNQPLFVVDGIPISNENFNNNETQRGGGGYDYGSMVNDLNSYDVESVDVLKGSAASALYGSRGQNGVIMITTKQGKKGKKDFSVEANSGVSFDQVSILPKLQTSYGGGYGTFGEETIDGKTYKVAEYDVDESWGAKYDPNLQVLHWWGMADYEQGITSTPQTAPWVSPSSDVKDFYELGVAYQNSVNITSTSENSAIRIGYTNINKTGIVPNSEQQRNSFNINTNFTLFDGFAELNSNVNYIDTYTKGRPQFGYGDNSQSQKFFQWGQRQLNMDKLKDYVNPDGTQRVWNRTAFDDPTPAYSDNPYWTAYRNYQDDDRKRIYGKSSLVLNLTNYLKATGSVYLDTYTFNQRERVSKGSQALSMYKQVNRQATEANYEGKLEFNRNVKDFNILAMLGTNVRKEKYSRFEGETSGGLVVDGLYNLNNSANSPTLDDYNREKRVNSGFGAVSVGFQNFVYVDYTFRKDFDSSLPTGHNSYSYSSVSTSLILSELVDFSYLSNLKLRANYGETGSGTEAYQIFNTYSISDPFNGNPQFTNSIRLRNQDLKPELTKEIEIGLEGSFLRNRIGFDFSWYDRNTENQIVPVESSGAAGYVERMINAGKINNTGIELLLYATPIKTRDFQWDISLNYAKNKNKVLELPEGLDKIQLMNAPFSGAYLNAVEGATFQELYVYNFKFDDNGNKVISSNGFYETGELESIGSVLPDFTAGVRNSFRYKNFDANALIDISQGGHYYSITNMWSMYSGMAEATATPTSNGNTIREDGIVLPGVLESGAVNTINISAEDYGAYHYHGNGTPSATSVFDASYMKLREVNLGYTLPKFSELVEGVRLSIYGRNLAVWGLDNKGIDPETVVGGSGNIQGLEGGIVPATRSYGVNVKINF